MTLLDEVDQLYEQSVTRPSSLNDQAIADWADSVATAYEVDRAGARYVRRCLNVSRKLAAFWSGRAPGSGDPDDWRSRVDLALGVRAWRPQLELAQHLLEDSPAQDTYLRAAGLFRLVNNQPFLDGMSFEKWYETRKS
jgi:hypothetical protein